MRQQWSKGKKFAVGAISTGLVASGALSATLLVGPASASAATGGVPAATTTAASFVPYPLQQLVDNHTITQAQASAVRAALCQYMQDDRPTAGPGPARMLGSDGALAQALAGLVKSGTITQAQASAITDAFSARFADRPGPGYGPGMMGGAGFGPPWAGSSIAS